MLYETVEAKQYFIRKGIFTRIALKNDITLLCQTFKEKTIP